MSNSIEQKFKVGDTILVPAIITEVDLDSPEYKLSLLDGDFLWATKETLSQCSSDTVPESNRAMIAAMCLQGIISSLDNADMIQFRSCDADTAAQLALFYTDSLIAELQKPKP
jgi:hypothetical protein